VGNSLVLSCLVQVEVVIFKYGSPPHFLKSSVRRRKGRPHTHARFARPGGAKDIAGAWSPFTILVCRVLNDLNLQSPKRFRS